MFKETYQNREKKVRLASWTIGIVLPKKVKKTDAIKHQFFSLILTIQPHTDCTLVLNNDILD